MDGTYTFSETGETRTAQLLFKDEYLFQVMGFKGTTTAGDASEITPNPGDTFTISYKWLDLDANGTVSKISNSDGDILTFGSQPFQWKQEWLPSGTTWSVPGGGSGWERDASVYDRHGSVSFL